MKKMILFVFILSALGASAQQDTTLVEQYCSVNTNGDLNSTKVSIEIDYGQKKNYWKNNYLKNEEGKIVKFNTVVDALNYLGKNGWKLVNAYSVTSARTYPDYVYIFKKLVKKSELE